ncbi:hypothetical protein GUJ93_ZPchr0005g15815 [Zizania palustris]|nr:hypothetical protein GUJ93_ZPchr0005g15815 [Zizania palustris]
MYVWKLSKDDTLMDDQNPRSCIGIVYSSVSCFPYQNSKRQEEEASSSSMVSLHDLHQTAVYCIPAARKVGMISPSTPLPVQATIAATS